MSHAKIKFGIIGCGLMGREFASAASRWCHLTNINAEPIIKAVCDKNIAATEWFKQNLSTVNLITDDYRELLKDKDIDAIYCAVPHHLHEQIYVDIIQAGKHLLGEKPFGIDMKANRTISQVIEEHPDVIVRCSSEMPFFPGAFQLMEFVNSGQIGEIIEVEAGLWHSSDLNPEKAINWKRKVATNGEYGCMGDLGMHVVHVPFRLGWKPLSVRALLSNLVEKRKNAKGELEDCETWDNAILACEFKENSRTFPVVLSMKRIAPGHANTWFIRVLGMKGSIEFSTQFPKQIKFMNYESGKHQVWQTMDVPYQTAYETITGNIFEFGFSDAILQMWAAFCDEVVNGKNMKQPLYCVTPEEAAMSHQLFTAALKSQKTGNAVTLH